ncbi:hypothetical protein AB0F03_30980 [Streptomyces sp. NPDC028722]|uniref:hypothetical protein n=1 Tax=Streptomyces sp. NPDC028722 TaxID=3155016 RepID=UPI0033F141C7
MCQRQHLADLVAADTPLGPEQAAARLRVRPRRLRPHGSARLGPVPQPIDARFGASRAGVVDVALYATAAVDPAVSAHPAVDREQLPTVEKGRCSRSRR